MQFFCGCVRHASDLLRGSPPFAAAATPSRTEARVTWLNRGKSDVANTMCCRHCLGRCCVDEVLEREDAAVLFSATVKRLLLLLVGVGVADRNVNEDTISL